ncbi:N-terminal glutamine amidase-domain-containing protein, partial [Vararia minispora EC-137]
PPFPPDTPYTKCYCEENVYLLAQRFDADATLTATWDPFVLFVSNCHRTVVLWKQKAGAISGSTDGLVVWDYHVLFILRPKTGETPEVLARDGTTVGVRSWVYDVDSTLPVPCPADVYFPDTFRPCAERYESLFRVIAAREYLDNFASDRSHMLAYHSPIPRYPSICGPIASARGVRHNLMEDFVDMSATTFGKVVGLSGLI